MSRSVVRAGTERCEQCLLPPRWCICGGVPPVDTRLQVDVLIHQRELWRPTSTGGLIQRAVRGARSFVHQRGQNPNPDSIRLSDRELWILHPRGAPLEPGVTSCPPPGRVQVLLLDGSWNEAGDMLRAVESWGKRVALPLQGPSRYWLREQRHSDHHSTIEALLGLLHALGLESEASTLRLHFELHVYASLRARGHKILAAEYLSTSPIAAALPEFLEQLCARRPNPAVPKSSPSDTTPLRQKHLSAPPG